MHLIDIKQGEKTGNFKCFGAVDVVTGYRACGNIRGIEYLRGRESDFVIRLKSGVFAVYTKEGERIELSEYFEGPGVGESGEVTVYYKAGEGYRPLWICTRRKSEEEEERGRKRLEKTNRAGIQRVKIAVSLYGIPLKPGGTGRAWFYGKLLRTGHCETVVNKGRFPLRG